MRNSFLYNSAANPVIVDQVQHISGVIAAGQTQVDVTIPSTDMTRSFEEWGGCYTSAQITPDRAFARMTFVNATTVRFTRNTSDVSVTVTCRGTLTTFIAPAVVQIIRGSQVNTGTTSGVALPSIDNTRAAVSILGFTSNLAANYYNNGARVFDISSTLLNITGVLGGGTSTTIDYSVIVFNSAYVLKTECINIDFPISVNNLFVESLNNNLASLNSNGLTKPIMAGYVFGTSTQANNLIYGQVKDSGNLGVAARSNGLTPAANAIRFSIFNIYFADNYIKRQYFGSINLTGQATVTKTETRSYLRGKTSISFTGLETDATRDFSNRNFALDNATIELSNNTDIVARRGASDATNLKVGFLLTEWN